ncbi:hypothetical protein [Streptomyces armeniacus]|uniref:hypothetical protein n=1 Tax=Streptomyces armeniacus TaxID=83291 RepID=UPI001AD84DC2|nr:hypothetical protein [Streptomyces armeniacus]
MTDPGGAQDPERDPDQDVHERQRQDEVHQSVGTRREPGGVVRVEQDPDADDQRQGLADLNGEHAAEGAPPPAGDAVGLRQGVAHQGKGCPDDQDDGESDPYDVCDQQSDDRSGQDDAQDDQEDAAALVQRVQDEVAQRLTRGALVDAVAHDRVGERVGEADRLPCQEQGESGGEEAERDAGGDLFYGVPPLDALVAHQDQARDHDQDRVAGDDDVPGVGPQLADPRQLLGGRGGQQRVAQQIQQRVEGGHDDALEKGGDGAVDGVLDPAGDAAAPVVEMIFQLGRVPGRCG